MTDIVKGACSDMLTKVSAKVSSIPQVTANHAANKDLQNVHRSLMTIWTRINVKIAWSCTISPSLREALPRTK